MGKRVVEKPIGSKKKDINEILFHAIQSLNKNRSSADLYSHEDLVEGIYRSDPVSGSHFELYFTDRDSSPDPRRRQHSYMKVSVLRPYAPPVLLQQAANREQGHYSVSLVVLIDVVCMRAPCAASRIKGARHQT